MLTPRIPEPENNLQSLFTGQLFNLFLFGPERKGYKSFNDADINTYPSGDGRIWMTGMSDTALKLYFKDITVLPISEIPKGYKNFNHFLSKEEIETPVDFPY